MDFRDKIIEDVARIEHDTFTDCWDEASIKETLRWDYNHMLALIENEKAMPVSYGASDGEFILAKISSGAPVVFFDTQGQVVLDEPDYLKHAWHNLVGYVIYSTVGDESELYRIAVKKGNRRRGQGTLLLKEYLKSIGDLSDKSLLEVRASNADAIKLYETNGYKKISTRKNYYRNPTEDAYIYEYELP